ncbi:MAG TPA: hypothetical protein VF807_12735 [Ktedonobacterales bacterium]
MAMLMMLATTLTGKGPLAPLYAIAATFHRTWTTAQGVQAGPLLLGAMLHMMSSIIYGVVFGLLAAALSLRQRGAGATVLAAMLWGLAILLLNQLIVLPVVDPALVSATAGGIFLWWAVSHLMFGLALGFIVARRPLAAAQPTASAHLHPAA